NLDSNTRSHHLLTQADDFAFAKVLIAHAHQIGLAIAQKNSAGHTKEGSQIGFDFAIAEECQVYNECQRYTKHYGDLVYEVEYTDNPLKYYKKSCTLRGDQISVILRDRDVTPRGNEHYHYEAC
ncbi:MAG: endo alpha-1,4 polygalactosaminidase, partial [Frankiaceae bacterium]|nr:endo alpha-1,4 polygalactosaminidase [Frankiaceae bacterium]